MAIKEIAGYKVDVNEEGSMTDHSQWNKDIAEVIAKEEGIDALKEEHWKVIEFIQEDFKKRGELPTIRRIKKVGNIPTKDLYDLFPTGPVKKASKIAGHLKPVSCV